MNFRAFQVRAKGLVVAALGAAVLTANAQAGSGGLAGELQSLDIASLAEASTPNWQVPQPIEQERGPVVAHELIQRLDSGYHLYGKYLYHDSHWHWLGIRAAAPEVASDRQRMHQLGAGRYENLTLDDLRSENGVTTFGLTTPCADDPESMAPNPLNPLPGEERDVRWTNTFEECDYEASFRYSSSDGGETRSWFLISFEYTFTGDVIGPGDGGDDDEQ